MAAAREEAWKEVVWYQEGKHFWRAVKQAQDWLDLVQQERLKQRQRKQREKREQETKLLMQHCQQQRSQT